MHRSPTVRPLQYKLSDSLVSVGRIRKTNVYSMPLAHPTSCTGASNKSQSDPKLRDLLPVTV